MSLSHRQRATIVVLVCLLPACMLPAFTALAQADGHIDPSAQAHRHRLTVARHADTAFTMATARSGFVGATADLQSCDSRVANDQDVACQVTVETTGTLGTFGTTGDGLDVITTAAELATVLGNGSAHAKVVTMINRCGGSTGSGIIGCAHQPGSSLVIVNNLNAATGEVLMHEFGHNQNLGHRDSPGTPFMHTSTLGNDEVNLAECAAYHIGGTAVGPTHPVDIAFIIDDTGSMGEEIGGVRTALTRVIDGTPSGGCGAFQLNTFKDDFTERAPTTDLSQIRSQVSSLIASGGGDCPEASVAAVRMTEPNIKNDGRAFIYTDASPRPGTDITGAIASLRARGIRVDAVLSNDCGGFFSTSQGVLTQPHNRLSSPIGGDEIVQKGSLSAIEAFSLMAQETGGIFAFLPGVNFGDPGELERYENTSFNIMQGAIAQSVALVQPTRGPRDSRLDVTLVGSGTNFQSVSSVSMSGGDVTISDVRVISPIEIRVALNIGNSAALGFRDITVTTPLGSGVAETATGVGAFEVTEPPFGPTILGVSPSEGEIGTTTVVRISGKSTSFSAASIPFLGADVTVEEVTALSAELLEVRVAIDSGAAIGFRDVTVTSGPEFAFETDIGPFFVAPASPEIPRIVEIIPSEGAPGSEVLAVIEGENTSFAAGISEVTVSGEGIDVLSTDVLSATRLTARLTVTPDAAPGFRDLRVTTDGEVAVSLGGFLVTADAVVCSPGAENLCLNSERFDVKVTWRDFEGATGSGRVVPFGSDDSGLFYFFDSENWEMLVKVLDGCSINDRFWMFSAATTNVEYTLEVTDTQSGSVSTYFNPLGNAAAAITDTDAFATCTEAVATLPRERNVRLDRPAEGLTIAEPGFRDKEGVCTPGDTSLCLERGRFRVEVSWRDFGGVNGVAQVVPFGSDDSGIFYFFDSDNWEMLVKVLDGCSINDRFWVFSAATTDVEYTLTVTDTTDGLVQTYFNPLGTAAPAITDTSAFSTCP